MLHRTSSAFISQQVDSGLISQQEEVDALKHELLIKDAFFSFKRNLHAKLFKAAFRCSFKQHLKPHLVYLLSCCFLTASSTLAFTSAGTSLGQY